MKRSLLVESKDTDCPLEPGFEPGEYDVICSRGKQYYNHVGNIRFRALIQDQVERYCRAENKVAKSRIVMSIVNEIRSASPSGGFVRFSLKQGCYVEIGDELVSYDSKDVCIDELNNSIDPLRMLVNQLKQAREKVGHALRERRKCGKQKLIGSPQTTVSDDGDGSIARVESIGPQGAKPEQRVQSSQGDERQSQMSIFELFASGYTKDPADTGHTRVLQDVQMTTETAVAHVLDMASEASEGEFDDTDLPDNFDIDSIF